MQCWGARSAQGQLSGEAHYLPSGGEAKGGFAFPTQPGFDLDTCSLVLVFLGLSFCKEMQWGWEEPHKRGVLGFCRCQWRRRSSTAVAVQNSTACTRCSQTEGCFSRANIME